MDIRAYLQWRIETHQAAKERARKWAERIGYILAMVAMTALWLAAWMIR